MVATIEAPAAGAPLVQVLIASIGAGGATVLLFALVAGHRAGRSRVLAVAGARASRLLGLPDWAALPFALGAAGLMAGGFGVFWDIAIHMGRGRDTGPLANPSHYPILFCLFACFAAGVVAVALHDRSSTPAARPLRLPGGIRAPVGGVLLAACGAFALTGFPLDDLWHRMFGQDVTLWGPTHLVMINGAILSVPALAVLALEGRRAGAATVADDGARSAAGRLLAVSLPGTLLVAVEFWSTEFDWGAPQYRMVWHPLLLAVAGALALAAGRVVLGRGGALGVLAFYVVARGAMGLAVDVLGETPPSMPMFAVEAVLVEVTFAVTARLGRPVVTGALAGLLCGTCGFAAQYAWTQAAMPLPWTPALLPEGAPTAAGAGVAGGVLGVLLGMALRGAPVARPLRRRAGVLSALALAALGANAAWTTTPPAIQAAVRLTPAGGAPEAVLVDAVVRPAQAVRDAHWFTATAWQGGAIMAPRMREVAPGRWRSERPVPTGGEWKTSLRLHAGRWLVALPLHLPRDRALVSAGVRRPPAFSAAFGPDLRAMQVERRDHVPGWLWTPSALLMLLACAIFTAAISAGIVRAAEPAPQPAPAPLAPAGGLRLR